MIRLPDLRWRARLSHLASGCCPTSLAAVICRSRSPGTVDAAELTLPVLRRSPSMAATWRWLAPQLRSCSSCSSVNPRPDLQITHLGAPPGGLRRRVLGAAAEPSLEPGDLRQGDGQLVCEAGGFHGREWSTSTRRASTAACSRPVTTWLAWRSVLRRSSSTAVESPAAGVRPRAPCCSRSSSTVASGRATTRNSQSPTCLLAGRDPDMVQDEPAVPGEPGGGAVDGAQLDPGGPPAQVPIHRRHHPDQLGLGESVEQHQLPATGSRHTDDSGPTHPPPQTGPRLPSILGASTALVVRC